MLCSMPIEIPFNANHPFLLSINTDKQTLFTGRIQTI